MHVKRALLQGKQRSGCYKIQDEGAGRGVTGETPGVQAILYLDLSSG